MEQRILEKIQKWDSFEGLEKSLREELENLKKDEKALYDAFYEDIAFGTGGLRGILGVGTNRMNIYVVAKTTKGFVNYMIKKYPRIKEMGVVISYDCRKNSDVFSKVAANVIAASGIKVYIFESLRSTPELSFSVRHYKAAGGIMITASHNPPIYNGYKVYDHEGCQLVPELADMCIAEVNAIENMFELVEENYELAFNNNLANGMIKVIGRETDKEYIKLVNTVKVQDVKKDNIKVVYTPLHGTGAVFMKELLEQNGYNVIPVEEQMVPDGNFSTLKSPNPEEASAFEYAIALGKKENADILIATDPDADRMGIAATNKEGEYVLLTGNQTGAILLDYLAKYKKTEKQRVVYNTIVTSNLAMAICKRHNIELVQTLTGFKFIGEQAALIEGTDKEFFFGYEESYGYVIKDFVRDKDSFQATLLLCEVASFYKEMGKTLYDVLFDIFDEYGYYIEGVHNISLVGAEGSAKINKIMTHFQQNPLKSLAGKEIVTIEDYQDSVKLERGIKSELTLPKSFVLKYIFEDGGWFVLRPSGTEPKLKIYVAIKGNTLAEAEELIKNVKAEVLAIIDQI